MMPQLHWVISRVAEKLCCKQYCAEKPHYKQYDYTFSSMRSLLVARTMRYTQSRTISTCIMNGLHCNKLQTKFRAMAVANAVVVWECRWLTVPGGAS